MRKHIISLGKHSSDKLVILNSWQERQGSIEVVRRRLEVESPMEIQRSA